MSENPTKTITLKLDENLAARLEDLVNTRSKRLHDSLQLNSLTYLEHKRLSGELDALREAIEKATATAMEPTSIFEKQPFAFTTKIARRESTDEFIVLSPDNPENQSLAYFTTDRDDAIHTAICEAHSYCQEEDGRTPDCVVVVIDDEDAIFTEQDA